MEVRAQRAAAPAAFVAAFPVVAEPRDDAAQRLGAGFQNCPSRMVLEPGDGMPLAWLELAVEEDVSDHAPLAGDRMVAEDSRSRKLDAAAVTVEAAEKLVAAADGEHCGSTRERLFEGFRVRRKVRGDQSLLAILTAADVEEIVLIRIQPLTEADPAPLEADPAPGRPLGEYRHVPSIGIDVEVIRIQVANDDLHAAVSSQ
jgi:hypothetical protein